MEDDLREEKIKKGTFMLRPEDEREPAPGKSRIWGSAFQVKRYV